MRGVRQLRVGGWRAMRRVDSTIVTPPRPKDNATQRRTVAGRYLGPRARAIL
jgi:hypothetical protein